MLLAFADFATFGHELILHLREPPVAFAVNVLHFQLVHFEANAISGHQ